jgi:DNA-binding response OmpR family regulator
VTPAEQHLRQRVESLKIALDLAQQRIDDLERAFGTEDELLPLRLLGLTPKGARMVHLLRQRALVTDEQLRHAMYIENPDQQYEVTHNVVKVQIHWARKALGRLGVEIVSAGTHNGYHMPSASKRRLDRLIASKARVLNGQTSDMRLKLRAAE